jgi:hypothetical protein
VNVTESVQLAPTPNVLGDNGQFEVCAKSPAIEIPEIVSGTDWLFFRVTLFPVLVVVITWLANVRLVCDRMTGAVPVPPNVAVCGEFETLSVTVSSPVRVPRAVGVKVTEILQFSLAPKVFGDTGQVEVWAKSPEVEIPVMVIGTVWLFCKEKALIALLVFNNLLPNETVEGDKTAGYNPVPLNCAVWGEVDELSFTLSVPLIPPRAVGVKLTEILQLAPAANVFGEIGHFEV